jgi:acyl transferase domain-containing protein
MGSIDPLPSVFTAEADKQMHSEPIAIIGMGFKLPQGAESSDTFWKMLSEKQCAATTFPKERFNIDAFWHPDTKRQNIVSYQHPTDVAHEHIDGHR